MTSTQRTPKDKSHAAIPRLAPRQTAASAARAARIAVNRNLTAPPQTQRQSPNRTGVPTPAKPKISSINKSPRCDSKSDLKASRNSENDIPDIIALVPTQENDTHVVGNLVVVETPLDTIIDVNANEFTLEEIKEVDRFEIKYVDDNIPYPVNDSGPVIDQDLRSRPHSPVLSSRPQTPKSLQSSRPQTPGVVNSRPTTPVHPRHTTPISRPSTPQSHISSRPHTPAKSNVESVTVTKPLSNPPKPTNEDEKDIKAIYSSKQQQFQRMKKELDLKQQAVLEIFDSLRGLRERMCQEGMLASGEGSHPQELMLFNVADWAADEIAQLCRDAAASASTDVSAGLIKNIEPFDEHTFAEVDTKVASVPTLFADLCLQAFTTQQDIVVWVKDVFLKHEINGEVFQRIDQYNSEGYKLCESLRQLKTWAVSAVESVSQLSRRAYQERNILEKVGESLVREIAHLRQDLEARVGAINEVKPQKNDDQTTKMLEETRQELEEERSARAAAKDKLSVAETQLRQTRARVSKMDRQLREAEASIASLTGTVKSLEDQSRQKEVQLEARARKLKESLKTGEVATSHIAQQRDALQSEVAELKGQLEKIIAQHQAKEQEFDIQLKEMKIAIEKQKMETQKEISQNEELNAALHDKQRMIENLQERMNELENRKKNPDLPTEREMDLWAELQATKDTLRIAEEDISMCKKEKIRFLETISKISETDNKIGMQQKLAAELLSKEEILSKMQTQLRELTKNIKLNEQKVIQYEQYVQNLQAHNRALANCQEAPNGVSYQDLQQEIMNLKMSLLEAVNRNEALSDLLVQKELQLEQQDKTSKAQARVIKVREELINMLKNKEAEQSRELTALQEDLEHRINIVNEVNKQIASKAEEIESLFSTLEKKQEQIHRLEKIVLAMEEQQRRAQAQRTRHEEKIAALEHELAASGKNRERRYLFF